MLGFGAAIRAFASRVVSRFTIAAGEVLRL
jgi:hypothetical protein